MIKNDCFPSPVINETCLMIKLSEKHGDSCNKSFPVIILGHQWPLSFFSAAFSRAVTNTSWDPIPHLKR